MTVEASLRDGLRLIDKFGNEVCYRYLQAGDDVEHITELLHWAYEPLAVRGMQFFASHQDSDTTRRRMALGETIVASDNEISGVVTLRRSDATHGSPFYDRPDVEQRASELGVRQLALDASEHAIELIALYEPRGFGFIEYVRWPDVNYRSVVLAKGLP